MLAAAETVGTGLPKLEQRLILGAPSKLQRVQQQKPTDMEAAATAACASTAVEQADAAVPESGGK